MKTDSPLDGLPESITPTVVGETAFRRAISLERMRCERTDGRFALALVDIEAVIPDPGDTALEEIAGAIAGKMRETDIVGWYRWRAQIGIILPTANSVERSSLKTAVIGKIKGAMSENLDEQQIDAVRITCYFFPEEEPVGGPGGATNLIFYPAQTRRTTGGLPRRHRAMKRMVDLTGSLTALITLSPLFAVISVAIKLGSSGPVLFRQTRVGQYGREFVVLKFRSMFVDNDPRIHQEFVQGLIDKTGDGVDGVYKIKNDPRVTPVGRILRKTSLDELPQFINVLLGQMSLVGPRPPIPYETERYSLWHMRRILEAKPGITGQWQVHGRSRTTFDEMVRMDLWYIRNQSIWLDLKILLQTPFAVFGGEGAH